LGSGRRLVDWIYIDDVVDGLLAVAGARSGACCDLGSGQLISIRAFAECVAERIGRGIRPDFGALPERPSEAVRAANAAETFKLLHWRPRVPLAEGLDRTVEWYRNQIAKGSMAPAEANLQSSAASSS
jgi:nucleoside-diphosphate-sugar epimerase